MRTPSELLDQIGEVVGAKLIEGRINVDFRWDNFAEAQVILSRLSTMLRELKLLRQELAVITKEVRRAHRDKLGFVDKLASEDDHLFGSGCSVSLQVDASMRRSIRVAQQEALAPYEEVRAAVDAVDLRLRTIRAQVQSSPEYLARPSSQRAAEPSNARRYFVKMADAVKGPLSAEQVSGLILAGVITREALVQIDGIDAWVPLAAVTELR